MDGLELRRKVADMLLDKMKDEKFPSVTMMNRVEAVIRAYDPCLSCSTHADGTMALQVQLRGPEGELLDEILR